MPVFFGFNLQIKRHSAICDSNNKLTHHLHLGKMLPKAFSLKSVEQLEEEIKKRSELLIALENSNKKTHKTNDELEQFTYNLSHDLPEPLRKIQAFSSLVINNNELDENKAYLQKIDRSAKRMKKLIQDVL